MTFYEVDWAKVVLQCVPLAQNRTPSAQSAEPAKSIEPIEPTQHNAMQPVVEQVAPVTPLPLLLDMRLTPLERNAWQILRWLINDCCMPTPGYQDLQPYLASSPCGGHASRETIARALCVLRLTGWLSLVERTRDERGCLRGCRYRLHEQALSPAKALELDSRYLAFVRDSLAHATKAVRDVAQHTVAALRDDPALAPQWLDGLPITAPHANQQALPLEQISPRQDSERGQTDPVRFPDAVCSNSEPGHEAPVLADVRMPDAACTVQTKQSSKKTVLAPAEPGSGPTWPETLTLSQSERQIARKALSQLAPDQRQAVINEAAVRCAGGTIRKPGAYLMGLIKRACKGEFTLWAARALATESCTAKPPSPPKQAKPDSASKVASPLALACLNELKQRCRVVSGIQST